MKSQEVYVLYSCDIWKSKNTMRLLGVFSKFSRLQDAVSNLITEETFECNESNGNTCRKCARCTDAKMIHNTVDFCYIDQIEMDKLV